MFTEISANDAASPRIQDMPFDQRPREKLARLGPAALDNAELMALFISTGTKGRSAIDIGRELVAKYGSIGALGGLPVAELAKLPTWKSITKRKAPLADADDWKDKTGKLPLLIK